MPASGGCSSRRRPTSSGAPPVAWWPWATGARSSRCAICPSRASRRASCGAGAGGAASRTAASLQLVLVEHSCAYTILHPASVASCSPGAMLTGGAESVYELRKSGRTTPGPGSRSVPGLAEGRSSGPRRALRRSSCESGPRPFADLRSGGGPMIVVLVAATRSSGSWSIAILLVLVVIAMTAVRRRGGGGGRRGPFGRGPFGRGPYGGSGGPGDPGDPSGTR